MLFFGPLHQLRLVRCQVTFHLCESRSLDLDLEGSGLLDGSLRRLWICKRFVKLGLQAGGKPENPVIPEVVTRETAGGLCCNATEEDGYRLRPYKQTKAMAIQRTTGDKKQVLQAGFPKASAWFLLHEKKTCAMSMAVFICRHTETCTVHRQTQHRPCTGPVLSMAVLQMGLALYRAKSVCKQSRNRRRPAPKPPNPPPQSQNPFKDPPPHARSPQSGTPKPEAPTQSGTEPDVARKPTKNDKTCVGFLAFRSGFAQFRGKPE